MTEKQFEEFSKKLNILTRLTALSLVAGKKQQEQFMLLSRAGFQPREIAEIVSTTPNTVRVVLSGLRSKKRRGGKS